MFSLISNLPTSLMPDLDRIPEPWGSFLGELDKMATDPVDFHLFPLYRWFRCYREIRVQA